MKFLQLTQEQKTLFEKDGFLVVRDALDNAEISHLLNAGDNLAEPFLHKAKVLNKPWYNDLDLRPSLLSEDAFYNLIPHASTVPLVVQLLGPNIHLHSTDLIYKHPEDPNLPPFRRGWHRDLRIPRDLDHQALPRVGIKVCYCLTDFHGPDSGMTLMARGSHLRDKPLEIHRGQIDPYDLEVCDLSLNAGDAVLFENRIFHTATPNRSCHVAKRIIYGYAYRWMKPEVYLDVPNKTLLDKADAVTFQLLGGYRDIDTPPWALKEWVTQYGVEPTLVPWTIEV
ncbi:phytanoyl-CoA dioxygenase family protein [Leptolyngbya cf. ectocarpi LEGE 11479]|uniref:Phytanoyl-CoA dioxygenase family protein n=1 Tax=Leptolyngbya cf. ectocarpi LEGE 11479 TaxID=1828722 RepID=A0A928ZX31_LEPEC|nr:phytanoyl-CoA dioxygenase family protein [Leptolyngbya ectocarpi]MBE9069028.1 phytanoyl-CoA dioxygenase family protein [Leptolyngbya cf. ectocarpi LEGE 11479]